METPALTLIPMTANDLDADRDAFVGTLLINPNGMPVFYQYPESSEYVTVTAEPMPFPTEENAQEFKLELRPFVAYYTEEEGPQLLWNIMLPREDGGHTVLVSGSNIKGLYEQGTGTITDYLRAYSTVPVRVAFGYIPDGTRRYYESDDFLVTLNRVCPQAPVVGKSFVIESFTEKDFNDRLSEYPVYWDPEAAMYDVLARLYLEEVIADVTVLPNFQVGYRLNGPHALTTQSDVDGSLFDFDKAPFDKVGSTPGDIIRSIVSGIARHRRDGKSNDEIVALLKPAYSDHYRHVIKCLTTAPVQWTVDEHGNLPEDWDWKRKPENTEGGAL